jgi:uncharacterized delta-60 repeat protein
MGVFRPVLWIHNQNVIPTLHKNLKSNCMDTGLHSTGFSRLRGLLLAICGLATATNVLAQPANDDFANAIPLFGTSASINGASNQLAGKEPAMGEPAHAGNAGGASVWFQWRAQQTAPVTVTLANVTFPTNALLAVYTGNALNSLTEVTNGTGLGGVSVTFPAVGRTNYFIAVDGFDGGAGAAEGFFDLLVSGTASTNTGHFSFARTLVQVGELERFVTLAIVRTGGYTGRIEVDWMTEDIAGGAVSDVSNPAFSDYPATSGRVIFDDFETMQTIQIPIVSTVSPAVSWNPVRSTDALFNVILTNAMPSSVGITNNQGVFFEDPSLEPTFTSTPVSVNIINALPAPTSPGSVGGVFLERATAYPINQIRSVNSDIHDAVNNPFAHAFGTVHEGANNNVTNNIGLTTDPDAFDFGSVRIWRTRGLDDSATVVTYRVRALNTAIGEQLIWGQPGSEVAQAGSDFVAFTGTVRFPAVLNSVTNLDATPDHIDIPLVRILGDSITEFNEDFLIELINVSPAPDPCTAEGWEIVGRAGNRFNGTGGDMKTIVTIKAGGPFDRNNPTDEPAGAADSFHNRDQNSQTFPPFNANPGANNKVNSVAVERGDAPRTILVGDFTAVNTIGRNRIARLLNGNAGGSIGVNAGQIDTTFDPGDGADNFINKVAIYKDTNTNNAGFAQLDKILIAGGFSSFDGVSRNGVARLNSNGSLDPTFNPGAGVDPGNTSANAVEDFAIQPDGKIILVGDFTSMNNQQFNRVVRLNIDGSVDQSFNALGVGPNARVYGVDLVLAGLTNFVTNIVGTTTNIFTNRAEFVTKIVIGGEFTSVNSVSRNGVALLDVNGAVDTSTFVNLGSGADNTVYDVVVSQNAFFQNTGIVIGGAFSTINFQDRRGIARLDADGNLDETFDPGAGANDTVFVLAEQANGRFVIGGIFTQYNGTRRVGIARVLANGKLDTTFMDTAYNQFAGLTRELSTMPRSSCLAIALEAGGNVVVGGSFDRVGSGGSDRNAGGRERVRRRSNIARLIGGQTPGPGNIEFTQDVYSADENGSTAFITLSRINGSLRAAAMNLVSTNLSAIAGADYTLTAATPRWGVGASGPNNQQGNTLSYVFMSILDDTEVEGVETFEMRLSIPPLSAASPFSPVRLISGEPIPIGIALGKDTAVLEIADNDFAFGEIGFSVGNYTANENAPGGLAPILVTRTNGSSGTVTIRYAVTGVDPSRFTQVSGTLTFGPGQVEKTFFVPVIDNTSVDGMVSVILNLTEPSGGATLSPLTTATLQILDNEPAAGTPAGTVNNGFGGVTGPDGRVGSVVYINNTLPGQDMNGRWLIGGDFTFIDGVPRGRMAMLNSDGSVNTTIFNQISGGFNGAVNAIAIHTNSANTNLVGRFIVGGEFTTYNGVNRNRIVRMNRDGTLDSSFNPGAGADNPIFAAVIQPDDKIIVVGDFTDINGTPRNRIARLNADGSVDITFDPGQGADGLIRTVALDPQRRIYLGGDFTGYNFIAQRRVARVDEFGTLDIAYIDPNNNSSGTDARVRSVALDASGRLIIAGDFNSVYGSSSYQKIARLDTGGGVDTTFAGTPGADNAVFTVKLDPQGRIILAGDFTQVNGKNRTRIARLTPQGALDASINFGTGPNGFVAALDLEPTNDGVITIGGGFTSLDDIQKNFVAQLVGGVNAGSGILRYASTNFTFTESAVNAIVTVKRERGLQNVVEVDYAAISGTAIDGLHFTNASGTLQFEEAEATETYTVTLFDDLLINADRVFTNILSNPINRDPISGPNSDPGLFGAATNGPTSLMTIINDDSEIELTFNSYTVNEQTAGGNAVIQISRTGSSVGDVSVFYSVVDGTNNGATTGVDYQSVSGSVTMTNGQTATTFLVPVIDDLVVEGDETALILLTNAGPTNLTRLGARSEAFLTIRDNDFSAGEFHFSQPVYTIVEDIGQASITVIRSNGFSGLVTVQYSSADVTARGWNGLGPSNAFDYALAAGTLTFADSESTKTFTVGIIDNQVNDLISTRTVRLLLRNPEGGAILGLSQANLDIQDNELAPFGSFSFGQTNITVAETSPGIAIPILRSGTAATNATVEIVSAGGTAILGLNYTFTNNTLQFLSGQNSNEFGLFIFRDPQITADRTLILNLTNASAGTAVGTPSQMVITIQEQTPSPGSVQFAGAIFTVVENAAFATVTVLRTNGFTGTVMVDYETSPATALAGQDYLATNGTLTFGTGVETQQFTIAMLDNGLQEGEVHFNVHLTNLVTGDGILTSNAIVSIIDDDVAAGSPNPGFTPGTGVAGIVNTVGVDTNGLIMAGGSFTNYNGQGRTNLIRLTSVGVLDQTFAALPITGPATASVRSLVVYTNDTNSGKVLIGGLFDRIGTNRTTNIARLNVDGTVDSSFVSSNGANNTVLIVALQPDERVLIGGSFTKYHGVNRNFIARLNADGTLDTSFAPGAGANGPVRAIAQDGAGKIYIGGDFTSVAGVDRNRIARLNADGSVDKTFDPGTAANNGVNVIVVSTDRKPVVGGLFTNFNNVAMNRLVRLNEDGSTDATFVPPGGANQFVTALAIQTDGKIIVGGGFTRIGGVGRNRFVRLHTNGVVDATYNVGTGVDELITAMILRNDNDLIIGGGFSVVNGQPRDGVARIIGGENLGVGSLQFGLANFVVNENGTNAVISVLRSGGTSNTVGISYGTADNSAVQPIHYTSTSGGLSFAQGVTRQEFTVAIIDNVLVDGNRLVNLALTAPTNGVGLGSPTNATLTIQDDDSVVGFSPVNYAINENDPGRQAVITVARAGGTLGTATVDYFTLDSTAVAGVNYVATSGTLVFAPGQSTVNFTVQIQDNSQVDGNLTVDMVLTNGAGFTQLGSSLATLTIVDNEFGPGTISFLTNAFTISETNSAVTVTIIRTNGAEGLVTADFFTTTSGTAVLDTDFTPTTTRFSWANGDVTARDVEVPIIDNFVTNVARTIDMYVTNVTGGGIIGISPTATVTIDDNDSLLSFTSTNLTVSEAGVTANVLVTRAGPAIDTVTVDYVISPGTASFGQDFTSSNGTLSFGPGESNKTFTLTVFDDTLVESDETVFLTLANPIGFPAGSATLNISNSILTISEDDVEFSFSSAVYTQAENGGAATLTITRNGVTNGSVLVDFASSNSTALGGVDYQVTTGILVFGPGVPALTFDIPIFDNQLADGNRSFNAHLLNVTGPTGARLLTPTNAVVTITDDDLASPESGTVDVTFGARVGANGPIHDIEIMGDDRILVGGDFSVVNGGAINRIARLNSDGTLDQAFSPGQGANSNVWAISHFNTNFAVGGSFTLYDGTNRSGLALIETNGALNLAFSIGTGFSGDVRALTSRSPTTLLVGGSFTNYNGTPIGHLVALNTFGGIDPTFNSGAAGANGGIYAIVPIGFGEFLLGGDFTSYNGVSVNRIVRISADGSIAPGFNAGAGADALVRDFAIQPDGKIVVVGDFQNLGPVGRANIGRLNPDGTVDNAFNTGGGPNGRVLSVGLREDGRILVVGEFTSIDGNDRGRYALLNPDGTIDRDFDPGVGANSFVATTEITTPPRTNFFATNIFASFLLPGTETNDVETFGNRGQILLFSTHSIAPSNVRVYYDNTLIFDRTFIFSQFNTIPYGPGTGTVVRIVMNEGQAFQPDWNYSASIMATNVSGSQLGERMLIGGDFTTIGGLNRDRLALVETNGQPNAAFGLGIGGTVVLDIGLNTNVNEPILLGKSVVVGGFTVLNGANANRIARLNPNGSLDLTFATGSGADATVNSVYVEPNGDVIIGGFFSSIDGIGRGRIARIRSSGALDASFDTSIGANNTVEVVTGQPDGKVLVGGLFTLLNGSTRNFIARLRADGAIDSTFDSSVGANGSVRAIAVQPDGKILIGGDFSTYNADPESRLARLNSDGSLDTAFNPGGAGADGLVNDIALDSLGRILFCGAFRNVNGTPRTGIARLTASGSLDSSFDPGLGLNDFVSDLEIQADGKIVVVGGFTTADGLVNNRIIRLNPDGSRDTTINFGTGANNFVAATLIQPWDSQILIGGAFTTVNGVDRQGVARINGDGNGTSGGEFEFVASNFIANEDSTNALVTVIRRGGLTGTATVQLFTTNNTGFANPATEYQTGVGGDYLGKTNTLVFVHGQISTNVVIQLVDDQIIEQDETVVVALRNPLFAGLAPQQVATLTIVDNDSRLGFSVEGYTVNENSPNAVITVVREGGGSGTISIDYTASSGTALAGQDFVPATNTLTWLSGDRAPKTFQVSILDDAAIEPNETVLLNLFRSVGAATLGISSAVLTIVENDFGPGELYLSTNQYEVFENGGVATMTVLRTNGSTGPVSARFFTADGTAKAGLDYIPTNGFVNFSEGQTSKTFEVVMIDDQTPEADESIQIGLADPGNGATLGLSSAFLIIREDEISNGRILFNQTNYVIGEGAGFVQVELARLDGSQGRVTVNFATTDGTAFAGRDYIRVSGTISFADRETNRIVNIPILNDVSVETVEVFNLALTEPTGGATTGTRESIVSINDDDFKPGAFQFTTNAFAFGSAQLIITNSFFGTNTVGTNFGFLTNVHFIVKDNASGWTHHFDEVYLGGPQTATARLGMHNPRGALISVTRVGGTDGIATVDISAHLHPELAPFSTNQLGGLFGLSFFQMDGVARDLQDFTPTDTTLTFLDGESTKSIVVPILSADPGDSLDGGKVDKFFEVAISNPQGASLGAVTNASVMIRPVAEGTAGFTREIYYIREDAGFARIHVLSSSANAGVGYTVSPTSVGGSDLPPGADHATAGADFGGGGLGGNTGGAESTGFFNTIEVASLGGSTSSRVSSVNLPIVNDDIAELPEAFRMSLIVGPAIVDTALVVILDDDSPPGAFDPDYNPDFDAQTVPAQNPTPGANNTVLAVGVQADGKSVIGGEFQAVNSVSRNRIARMNLDGSLDTTFQPGVGANGFVSAISLYNDSDTNHAGLILIGGGFTSYDGTTRSRIARLMTNGVLDVTFNPGDGANGNIRTIAVYTNGAFTGKILIGGEFTTYNGTNATRIARLNADG